jgi:hypothetical protein
MNPHPKNIVNNSMIVDRGHIKLKFWHFIQGNTSLAYQEWRNQIMPHARYGQCIPHDKEISGVKDEVIVCHHGINNFHHFHHGQILREGSNVCIISTLAMIVQSAPATAMLAWESSTVAKRQL